MGPFRGLILIIFALLAFYRAWVMRSSGHAWMAGALGVAALALRIWHIVRESKQHLG